MRKKIRCLATLVHMEKLGFFVACEHTMSVVIGTEKNEKSLFSELEKRSFIYELYTTTAGDSFYVTSGLDIAGVF